MASGHFPSGKTPEYTPYPAAPSYDSGPSGYPPPINNAPNPSAPTLSVHGSPADNDDVQQQRAGESEQQPLVTFQDDDVFKLTPPVQVNFQDVFREVKGMESPEAIFNVNQTIFNYTARGLYTFLAVVVGVILSIVWGIVFGALNFVVIWFAQPSLKVLFVGVRIFANAFGPATRAILDPFFQSWGLLFSKFRGAFQFNISGVGQSQKRRTLTHEA